MVRGFRAGSTAQQAGVKLGDILIGINDAPIGTFQEAVAKLKSLIDHVVLLTVSRG